jgi:hypothetical protein
MTSWPLIASILTELDGASGAKWANYICMNIEVSQLLLQFEL